MPVAVKLESLPNRLGAAKRRHVNVFDSVRHQRGRKRALREALLPRKREFANIDDLANASLLQSPNEGVEIQPLVSERIQVHRLFEYYQTTKARLRLSATPKTARSPQAAHGRLSGCQG